MLPVYNHFNDTWYVQYANGECKSISTEEYYNEYNVFIECGIEKDIAEKMKQKNKKPF